MSDRRPVPFAIALPDDWRYLDLLDPDQEPLLDGAMRDVLAIAREGGKQAEMLMLRSLVAFSPDGEPLTAGLSVALAYRDAAISSSPLSGAALAESALADAELSAIELPVGAGVRLTRVVHAPSLEPAGRLAMLSVQYAVQTEAGLLTVTFTTPLSSHPEAWHRLFDAMAATCRLG